MLRRSVNTTISTATRTARSPAAHFGDRAPAPDEIVQRRLGRGLGKETLIVGCLMCQPISAGQAVPASDRREESMSRCIQPA